MPASRYAQAPGVGGSKYLSGGAKGGSKYLPGGGSTGFSDTVPALEQEAAAAGAPDIPQDSPGLFRRAIDILSRPNYAVAGAAEELLSPQGGGLAAVPGRVGSELFSGIGNIKGQKEGFGQVMEQAGVPDLGRTSGLLPKGIENLSGASGALGRAFGHGGVLDFTGRGTIGTGLDIAADPLNLVNPAAIAKSVIPTAARDAIKSTIRSVPAFDKALNAVGGVFNRDWKIRNLPGAEALKKAHLNRHNYETSLLYDGLENSQVAAIPKSERAGFVDAMDQGTWAEKYKGRPKMLEAAKEWQQWNNGFAINDVQNGLLDASQIRDNYAAHFYENSPEELSKVMSLWPRGKKYQNATLGRHAELRAFDTLAEAEKWSKAQHAIDPSVPVLKPLRDPLEVLRRRGEASIDAAEFKQYYQEIVDRFGRQDIPFKPEDFHALTQEVPVPPAEETRIGELVTAGKTPIAEFEKLSAAGKQEFVRQRLLAAKSPEETLAVLNKYGVANAPKQKALLGTLAEDGSPYKSVTLGSLKAEIPQSMAEDLADMSERVLKSKEMDYLLRWYDRANNTFKSFVTVMFPVFHFRNVYSNVAQGVADAAMAFLNPARHADALGALRGAGGELVTRAGERVPYAQLQDEMARNGVTTTGRRMLEYTGSEGLDRLSTIGGKIKAAPRAFGGAIENEARAALYTTYRRRGMDPAEAADRVNRVLFDYTDLSRVEQDFFRRAIPFYTWSKKNLAQQVRNLTTKPGLTAAEVKPFRGREDENGQLTSWDAEALKIRLNRDGKTLRVLSGVDIPVKGLDFIWNGNLQGTLRQQIGMLSPVVKAPLEVAFGVNAFTGKDMTTPTQSNAVGRVVEALNPPEAVKQWMGYHKTNDAAGRPKYTFDGQRFYILFQSWALSRMISTSDRQFRALAQSPEWSKILLDVTTGLQDKTMNLDDEQAKKLAERKRQLEQNLIRWGQRKEFRRTYTPKGQ